MVGKGMSSNTWHKPDSTGKINRMSTEYSRFLLQANFAARKNNVQLAFSARILVVHDFNMVDNMLRDFQNLDILKTHLYGELEFQTNIYIFPFLKPSTQAGVNLPIIRGIDRSYYNFDFAPINLSPGMVFNIHLIKQAEKE